MKTLLSLLLLFVPALSRGVTVSVGGTPVELPNPPGFVEVTPQMTAAHDLGLQLVPPNNVQFAAFMPESEVAKALKGEMPDFTRRFSVQTVKTIVNQSASAADFAKLKTMMRTQNEEIIKKLEAKAPALMDTLSQNLSKHYDTKMALSLSQVVPFPAHEESERTFAYAMLMKYNVGDASGETSQSTGAVTTTLMHIKGKILFFYCFAEEGGLDWTKTTSKEWSSAILAANPSSPIKESLARVGNGFDWHEVGKMALVGAGAGLAVALLGKLFKRKR